MKRLRVAGAALRGSGYPNAERTVAILSASGEWDVTDAADWLPPDMHLWRLVRGTWRQRVELVLRLGFSGFKQAVRALYASSKTLVYVPYPAPLMLWWLSFCPRRWRPKCIADAYISIWDSMFRDRANGSTGSVAARLLWRFERRSLRAAHRVLVDTQANRLQLIADFDLSPDRVFSVPLAINEDKFLSIIPRPTGDARRLRVLFVGTLVPLHGIDTLLAAIEELAGDDRFEFRLVGDGQMTSTVEAFVESVNPQNFTWAKSWYSLERIADEISQADICLGVFGGQAKAARVLPFKIYMYLAAGRPVVTQSSMSRPGEAPAPPVFSTSFGALSIADALRIAFDDRTKLASMARESREYYLQWLCNAKLAGAWQGLARDFN